MTIFEYLQQMKEIGDKAHEVELTRANMTRGRQLGKLNMITDCEFIPIPRSYWDKLLRMNEILLDACGKYVGKTSLEPPPDWNCFKNGREPYVEEYEDVNIGDVAERAISECEKLIGGEG